MNSKLEWAKAHKKEILIGAAGVIGTGVLVALGVKSGRKNGAKAWEMPRIDGTPFEETSFYKTFMAYHDSVDHTYQVDLEPVPIKELGNIGQNFLKLVPGTTEDTLVQTLAYIEKKDLVAS